METQTMTSESQAMDQEENQPEGSPMDGMISQVESYIKDPKMVNVQTLTDLRDQLVDLKGYVDSEDGGNVADESDPEPMSGKSPALSIIIGHGGKK